MVNVAPSHRCVSMLPTWGCLDTNNGCGQVGGAGRRGEDEAADVAEVVSEVVAEGVVDRGECTWLSDFSINKLKTEPPEALLTNCKPC